MNKHPFLFTWKAQADAQPLSIVGGQGATFHGEDGHNWIDLGSLTFNVNVGHGHPRMIAALCEQVQRLCVASPHSVFEGKSELAEELLSIAPPGFSKVFFTLGGSDANESALKIARLATGRYKIMSRYRSYHGSSMGAVSLTGDWRRPLVEPGLMGVVHVPDWEWLAGRQAGSPYSLVERILHYENPSSVAAVFVEPIVGANGVLIPPPEYLRELRQACSAHGVLLVFDEVLTGFGRTGKWFGFEHFEGAVPDMITIGKGLTGGYGVLGAVLVHERIAARFEQQVLATGLTGYAHPLGIAAARAALQVYRDEQLVARAQSLEPVLLRHLAELQDRWPDQTGERRAIGLLGALELRVDQAFWPRLQRALAHQRIHMHLRADQGLLLFAPPLVVTEEELAEGFRRVVAAVEESLT